MEDHKLLDFVSAMCANGATVYYRWPMQDEARAKFAEVVANQAGERLGEGREILQRLKGRLRQYLANVLQRQLNGTLGDGFVSGVNATESPTYMRCAVRWASDYRSVVILVGVARESNAAFGGVLGDVTREAAH